jgi:hypothetical protein
LVAVLVAVFFTGTVLLAAFEEEPAVRAVAVPAFFAGAAVAVWGCAAVFVVFVVLAALLSAPARFVAGAAFVTAPVVLLAVARLAAVVAAAVFFAAIRPSVAQAVDADKWG